MFSMAGALIEQECRICGCTDDNACVDMETYTTCFWVEDDLCSSCVELDKIDKVINGGRTNGL